MKILLTGGIGYIGSHTAVQLQQAGYDVVIVDNLTNSEKIVKNKIEEITGKKVTFYPYDVKDEKKLEKIFKKHEIGAVIHFAGLKAVGESTLKPIEYYDNNIVSTLSLLKVMRKYGCKNLVFSSSATVYGKAKRMPIEEDFETGATNPYGRTKLFIEEILKDVALADKEMNIILLRYFNPVGAHESGLIGENPKGIPNNLMPYIMRVASGKLECLSIYGNDYATKDGTGVRDYIHVVDLADGHLAAIRKLSENPGLKIYNLGTGTGYSVLEMVDAYNKVCGGKVKYKIVERRPGDIDECYASPKKAKEELGWEAKKTLQDMCTSAYNYENKNK